MTTLNAQNIIQVLEETKIVIASEPIGKTGLTKKLWVEPITNDLFIFDGQYTKQLSEKLTFAEIAEAYNRI